MNWIKDRLSWLAGGLLTILGIGGAFLYMRKRMLSAQKRAELAEATGEALVYEEQIKHLKREVGEDDEAIKQLEKELVNVRREAVSVISNVEGMTDDEVLRRFEQLGY